jgi:hypothetical protein
MADPAGIIPFRDFVRMLEAATPDEYSARADSRLEDPSAFEEFRKYLIDRYSGVDVPHSFLDDAGRVIDCIPIEQQPALKGTDNKILKPPTLPELPVAPGKSPPGEATAQSPLPHLSPDRRDRYGNQMYCPAGTIPVLRTTLDTLVRFRNLRDFFRKAPDGGRVPDESNESIGPLADGFPHRWAHAKQFVSNLGGSSSLNVWQPRIAPNEWFSLSQHWYVAGSGRRMQTLECGWQVSPRMYNTPLPCLFIYWTRANYADGSGCYNLDCAAFIKTDSSIVIPGTLTPSQPGGSQCELSLSYYLNDGAWWLYVQSIPVGYYPVSIFRNGALSRHANSIDYGGETVGQDSFPPMGSGQFPQMDFGKAAYQRNVGYFPSPGKALEATLTPFEPSPACYKILATNHSGTSWGSYFYFGGPGGTTCLNEFALSRHSSNACRQATE